MSITTVTRASPLVAASPTSPVFHFWAFPKVVAAGGTTAGDELLRHPNCRVAAIIDVNENSIDYCKPPGGQSFGYGNGVNTNANIAIRWCEYAKWQGWLKGQCTVGGSNDHEGALWFKGYGRNPSVAQLMGLASDKIGSSSNPCYYHTPFAASAIAATAAKTTDICNAIKTACDGGYDGQQWAYPGCYNSDIEMFDLTGAGALTLTYDHQYYDGTEVVGQNNDASRGSVLHGQVGLNVVYTGTDAYASITKTGNAGEGTVVLKSGSSEGAASTTLTYNCTGSTTVNDVVAAIDAITGWNATAVASGSTPFYCVPFIARAAKNQTRSLWARTWKVQSFGGWLYALTNASGEAYADSRKSSEVIYEEWTGSTWAGRTFNQWWTKMTDGTYGHDFSDFDPADGWYLNSGVSNNWSSAKQKAFYQRLLELQWRITDYRVYKGIIEPMRAVFPALRYGTEYFASTASAATPWQFGDGNRDHAIINNRLRIGASAPSNYVPYNSGAYYGPYDGAPHQDVLRSWARNTVDQINSGETNDPVMVWVCEPGEVLNSYTVNLSDLRYQLRLYVDASKDVGQPYRKDWCEFSFYTGLSASGYRTEEMATDQEMLDLVNHIVSGSRAFTGFRRR